MKEKGFYICPVCSGLWLVEQDAKDCCPIHMEYACGKCGNLYKHRKPAEICCKNVDT